MSSRTYHDLVSEAKTRVAQVSARESLPLKGDPQVVFLDCREPNEFALGRIPGAVFIPRGVLEQNIERAVPRERRVIIYCASGNRSALAADTLQQMGYANVASLAGGIRAWMEEGGEIEG
jgi:rhodanese-related sulfurtransferase